MEMKIAPIILMNDDVEIQQIDQKNVPFEKQEMVPNDLNLSFVTKIAVNQLLSLKAKSCVLTKSHKGSQWIFS